MSERKTPEERAAEFLAYEHSISNDEDGRVLLAAAFRFAEREAADDALERAANLATGHACKGYCEHDYCVAAHEPARPLLWSHPLLGHDLPPSDLSERIMLLASALSIREAEREVADEVLERAATEFERDAAWGPADRSDIAAMLRSLKSDGGKR